MEWNPILVALAALERHHVDYVVIGGIALNLHGITRATTDIDVFIAPTADNIHRLRTALHSIYSDVGIDDITEADLCGDYPVVRYIPPPPGLPIDIVTRLGTAVQFADVEHERYDVNGQNIVVATPRALFNMKCGTVRPQDHADAARLRAAFSFAQDGD
jgi:hypothetical protein